MGAAAELRVPASTAMAQRRKSESGFRPARASTAPFPPQDIPSDITIEVEGKRFFLHKFPLLSRSGWIRKLLVGASGTGTCGNTARGEDIIVQLPDFPGGAAVFELAARFCYGQALEIGSANVVALRCAAEYLVMTDDFGSNNLLGRCETLLKDSLAGGSLGTCVKLLQSCESLVPAAEDLDIVSRCIDAVAAKACKEQVAWSMSHSDLSSNSSRFDSNESWGSNSTPRNRSLPPKPGENGGTGMGGGGENTWWWAEELVALRVEFFQRVLAAMRARGLRYDCLGGVIVHYAQQSLKGLIKKQVPINGRAAAAAPPLADPSPVEHQQRILIETIVSLLPPERNVATTPFLFGLLRAAIYLDTTLACRLDLEARIAMQLDSAALDDLLIPAYAFHGDTLFDVDTIRRIVITFLQQQSHDQEQLNGGAAAAFYDSADDDFDDVYDDSMSPLRSRRCSTNLIKAASLIDSFLAEIAPDANLSPAKFTAIAELMPDHSRPLHDGLYRAIDIYLKAHPGLNDAERKKVCGHLNCRKLSQDACTHAAQNERLPVNVVVQVLYFEQMRLKNAMGATAFLNEFEDEDDDDGIGSAKSRLQRSQLPPPPVKIASSASRTPQMSLRDQLADDEDTIDIDIDNTADRITLDSGTGLSPALNRHRPPVQGGGSAPVNNMYAAIFRENQELKMEMARMRMQLSCSTSSCESMQVPSTNRKQLQQPIVVDSAVNCTKLNIDHVIDPSAGRTRRTSLSTAAAAASLAVSSSASSSINQSNNNKHGSKLLSSFTKTLGKLNPFQRSAKAGASAAGMDLKPRRRRHSVS